jgi:hypothetical protein
MTLTNFRWPLLAATALLALGGATTTAHAAVPPKGAFTYVGNVDDGSRSGVVDRRGFLSSATKTFSTALDDGDDMAVGDVLGDGFDELLVADDGRGRIDVHDTSSGATTDFSTSIGQDVNAYDSVDDDLTAGNLTGDNKDEIIVGSTRFKMLVVYSASGQELKRIGPGIGYDSGDRVVAGDFIAGNGLDEVAVVSDEDEGRIDIYSYEGELLRTAHSGYDGDGDDVAAGDDTGDGIDEVIVANDEKGRIDSVDFATGKTHNFDSAYDSDDKLGVGDATGDGIDEVVVANTESNRIDVTNFFGKGGNFSSAYDSDDRFAVGKFGAGDTDLDGIPDRTELIGVRDGAGNVVYDLKAHGASPCRKDVFVELDHMASVPPDQTALDNVEKTFADTTDVQPVANCPYTGVNKNAGMNLVIENGESIADESPLSEARLEQLITAHRTLKSPFIRYALWADNYVKPNGDSPAGEAGHGPFGLDFVIALDGKPDNGITNGVHESTFMHELGHSLGLVHGGTSDVNCKPNYLSIMNYSFRTGLPATAGGFKIDFSHAALPQLDEKGLDESKGIGGDGQLMTIWTNGKGETDTAASNQRIDWNGSNGDGESGVKVDTNLNDGLDKSSPFETCENPNDGQIGLQTLNGHDDWAQLNTALAGPDGVTPDDREPTVAQLVAGFEARDQVFFPDATAQLRPELAGQHGDALGVAVDADHVYATHNYRAPDGAVIGNGSLVTLNRTTLAVEGVTRVGLDARAVAVNPVTKRAYVVNRGIGTGSSLSVINTVNRAVIKEIPLGQVAVDVAVNTRLNRVYVSNPTAESLMVLNGATNTLLPAVKVGKGIGGMAVDEATGIVYIAMTFRSAQPSFTALARVQDTGAVRTVLGQVDLGDPGIQATDVALAGGRVYVGGLGGGTVQPSVTVLDAASMQQLARIPMRGPVRAIAADAQSGLVAAAGDRGLDVIDGFSVIRRMDAGIAFSIATAGSQLFAGDALLGRLSRLSFTSGTAL